MTPFRGGDGNDLLIGGAGNDELSNGTHDDTVLCGDGDDNLVGGIDNNLLMGESGSDRVWLDHLTGSDTIVSGEGGADVDTLVFQPSNAGVTVTFTGSEAGTYSVSGSAAAGIFSEIEQVSGFFFADRFHASAPSAPVFLAGCGGSVTLSGGTGDDTMDGGNDAGTSLIGDRFGDDIIIGD